MKCERCGKDHRGSFGSGRFCSITCSNARTFSEESKQKKRDAGSWVLKLKEEDPVKYAKFVETQREAGLKRKTQHSAHLLALSDAKSWDEVGKDVKRRRVIESQDNKCNNCGLSKWQGQLLTLELEHKDGNHMNDERENLEALCPNCHSITHTWRGRNTEQSKKGQVSDEVLTEALKATDTIRQALIVVGLSPRGGNYVRAKRLKEKYV